MFRRPKILVVGSFMMDLIASTPRAPHEGETVVGLKFRTAPGGKGANQAVQCARLGAAVTMVGRVGADAFGETLKGAAAAAGVDVTHVTVDESESSGVGSITLEVSEHDARNRIVVCPGANFTMRQEHIVWLRERIGDYDLVMMQLELPMEIVETVAAWAHEAGVPVMLNPAPAAPLSDALLANVTFLSPNEHEAALLSGQSIGVKGGVNMDDLRGVAAWFADRGVSKLIVTLGENGAVITDGSGLQHADSVHMDKVADTTAAGDSFVAAFCTAFSAGLPELEALRFAAYAAAITVSRMGAIPSLPTLDEVKELMRQRGEKRIDLDVLKGLE